MIQKYGSNLSLLRIKSDKKFNLVLNQNRSNSVSHLKKIGG